MPHFLSEKKRMRPVCGCGTYEPITSFEDSFSLPVSRMSVVGQNDMGAICIV